MAVSFEMVDYKKTIYSISVILSLWYKKMNSILVYVCMYDYVCISAVFIDFDIHIITISCYLDAFML